jgi:hypothetical protein
MNTLFIVPLIVPGLITFMLISLIIKERDHLFSPRIFKGDFQKKKHKNEFERKKRISENHSAENGTNFLDFSGGVFGI